jgi:single-strand DNA-binding protein
MNINVVVLGGNLTRDPELRYTPSGTAICEFTIANSKKYKQNDEWQEKTGFYNCICWGKRGEIVNEYFEKGRPILVKGELEFQQWETKDGDKRSTVKINVQDFDFVGGKQDAETSNTTAPPKTDNSQQKLELPDSEIPF